VGQEFLRVLHERNFPYSDIKMLASARSAGRQYEFEGQQYTVEELTDKRYRQGAGVVGPLGWGRQLGAGL